MIGECFHGRLWCFCSDERQGQNRLLTHERLLTSRTAKASHDAFTTYQVELGSIGKDKSPLGGDEVDPSLNNDIASFLPVISQLIEDGHMQPNEVEVFGTKEGGGGGGFEAIGDAVAYQQKGGAGKKVVVMLQEV